MNRRVELGALLCALPYRRAFLHELSALRPRALREADIQVLLRSRFTSLELGAAHLRAKYDIDSALTRARESMASVTCWFVWESAYPASLAAIFDPPAALFVHSVGARASSDVTSIFEQPGLAIVGTRNPHPVMATVIRRLLHSSLAARPATPVISGFARGVDRLAHAAAIESGAPGVAVLGAGVLMPGPRSNLDLLQQARGRAPFLLVSEFGLTTPGHAGHFPRRNRIIAGLSRQVVVAQAPARSGALITADYAIEEGRDLMVFDHPVLDTEPGCNDGVRRLLADGAERLELGIDAVLSRFDEEFSLPGRPATARQLEFWRATLGSARELGGGYLLED